MNGVANSVSVAWNEAIREKDGVWIYGGFIQGGNWYIKISMGNCGLLRSVCRSAGMTYDLSNV